MKIHRGDHARKQAKKKAQARRMNKKGGSKHQISVGKPKPEWKIKDYDGLAALEEFAGQIGAPLPPKPKVESIEWPESLPDTPYRDLSKLLGHLGSLTAWISMLLKAAESERDYWEDKYVHALDGRILKHENEGYASRNQNLREAMADEEPDIRYRLKRHIKARNMAKYLEGLLYSYDNLYQKLSRELTMREAQWAREK